jgi:hypothetical protein
MYKENTFKHEGLEKPFMSFHQPKPRLALSIIIHFPFLLEENRFGIERGRETSSL